MQVSPDLEKVSLWNGSLIQQSPCLIPSVNSHPTYLEKGRSWNSNMGPESLSCVPSSHTNLKGGAYVTRNLLANHGLHSVLPVRSGGGCFRAPCCWFNAVAEEAGVVCVSCSVCYCWVLWGEFRRAQTSRHGEYMAAASNGKGQAIEQLERVLMLYSGNSVSCTNAFKGISCFVCY